MASCPKCGKHIKRRKGIAKCKHCGPLTVNGHPPQNPFGSCFDAAAWNLLHNLQSGMGDMRMCHGVGISNHPDSMGKKIAHAWVEFDHPQGRAAFDPIFLLAQSAEIYRKNFKTEIVVEYTTEEFIRLWKKSEFPGPYDVRVAALTKDAA